MEHYNGHPLLPLSDTDPFWGMEGVAYAKTERGCILYFTFSSDDRTAIGAGADMAVWTPEAKVPLMLPFVVDNADPNLGIPDETGVVFYTLVGGPNDTETILAANGRAYVGGDREFYCHIDGDPENELRHANTYLYAVSGSDYSQIQADRDAVAAWKEANDVRISRQLIPVPVSALGIDPDVVEAHYHALVAGFAVNVGP